MGPCAPTANFAPQLEESGAPLCIPIGKLRGHQPSIHRNQSHPIMATFPRDQFQSTSMVHPDYFKDMVRGVPCAPDGCVSPNLAASVATKSMGWQAVA